MTERLPITALPLPATAADDEWSVHNPWLGMQKKDQFFENEEVLDLVHRGLFYARAGVPIHFQGGAGLGKTAVAIEIASRLKRPVSIMTGNEWLDLEDMVGRQVGQSTHSIVDRYVQHVKRSEATTKYDWENSILAEAMLKGHTLVYDEFTRSNAKANGVLLSVLEEGVLIVSDPLAGFGPIQAHANFRIILTSNPHDYAGVNQSPDALLDRMVTFQMTRYSPETESGIVAARTGIPNALARSIVFLVNDLSIAEGTRSMRAAILIAQVAAMRLRSGNSLSDALLAQISADVLAGRGVNISTKLIAKYISEQKLKGNAA